MDTHIASQIYGNDCALFTNGSKVADLVSLMGYVHHIFPVEYLKSSGVKEKVKYNQVANLVYLDTQVNISIGKKPPSEYFGTVFKQCETGTPIWGNILDEQVLKQNLRLNCIPEEVRQMTADDYTSFLLNRRQLMAAKIKEYYKSL